MIALLSPDRADCAIDAVVPSPKANPVTQMPWEELGFLIEGLSLSSRPMHVATADITEQFSLGPRGAWILALIERGVVYPLDITNVFRIGRSLISAELARLTEAGMITAVKNADDGRRTQLALTPLGCETCVRVRDQMRALVAQRLAGYSYDELMLCARMLSDFRRPTD